MQQKQKKLLTQLKQNGLDVWLKTITRTAHRFESMCSPSIEFYKWLLIPGNGLTLQLLLIHIYACGEQFLLGVLSSPVDF